MRVRRGLLRGPAPRPLPRSGHRGRTRGRRWGPGRLAPRRGHSRPTLPPSVCGPSAARKLSAARPGQVWPGPFPHSGAAVPSPLWGAGSRCPSGGGPPGAPSLLARAPLAPAPGPPGPGGARLHPPPGALPRLFASVVSGCSPAPAVWRRVCLRRGFLPAGVSPPPVPLRGRRKARRGPVPSGAAWPGF